MYRTTRQSFLSRRALHSLNILAKVRVRRANFNVFSTFHSHQARKSLAITYFLIIVRCSDRSEDVRLLARRFLIDLMHTVSGMNAHSYLVYHVQQI